MHSVFIQTFGQTNLDFLRQTNHSLCLWWENRAKATWELQLETGRSNRQRPSGILPVGEGVFILDVELLSNMIHLQCDSVQMKEEKVGQIEMPIRQWPLGPDSDEFRWVHLTALTTVNSADAFDDHWSTSRKTVPLLCVTDDAWKF